jgi:hypothetical protein
MGGGGYINPTIIPLHWPLGGGFYFDPLVIDGTKLGPLGFGVGFTVGFKVPFDTSSILDGRSY